MEVTNISISSGSVPATNDHPIRYELYAPVSGTSVSVPVVLFLHGFKGFKDWGTFPDICEELCYAGFAVVAFNFSTSGIGDRRFEFDRLDLFEQNTLSQDLDDVGSIIQALQKGVISDHHTHLNTDMIGIVGHSRGAQTALVAGAEYETIQTVVSWNAVANYLERWPETMVSDWNNKGFTDIKNSRTGQTMRVKRSLYDDAIKHQERILAEHRMADLRVPVLFIHGREDETIPYTDSEKLHIACASNDKELRLVANGGHTFGGSHPFEAQEFPKPLHEVVEWTKGWFTEYLKG
ncbi:MAG: alpha/beta fold hydrolase [Bacteroidota bacterium]